MSPEQSAAIAAWVAAGLAGLFGITGFVVGLVGLHHARQAKEAAAAANLIAKDANQLAGKANELADESNGIAREANEISGRVAARSDEQHDVDWEWRVDPDNDDMVLIQNIGKNDAHEAIVQFMFRDQTEATKHPIVIKGREEIRFFIPTLRQARERARTHRATQLEAGTIRVPYQGPSYRFRLRVTWRTELGAPKQFDTGWRERTLPE